MMKRTSLTEAEVKKEKRDKKMNAINRMVSFYRANPHRFAKDYLGIKLDPFQQIILCMMFKNINSVYLASRGGGKTFLLAVFTAVYAILYPGSRICIASKTRGQASEVIKKIKEILMPLSPSLCNEIKEIKQSQTETAIEFHNNSRIFVVTTKDTSRGNRATILIVDEYRMVDKNTIDTVLVKFLTVRREPGYLNNPKYKDSAREPNKQVYASSCWYENHWSYEHVRDYVVKMIMGKKYFCCAMPYQLAIKQGRLDPISVENEMSEATFSPIAFQMEMQTLFFGENSGGLYNFNEIDNTRKIDVPVYPKSLEPKIGDKKLFVQPKENGEIRILSADIALMSSRKHKNDATSIFINFMKPAANGKYVNNIVYTENNEGLRTDAQALNIRRLFEEYDCDYLVLDVKGLGIGVCDALMDDIYDQKTGVLYEALSCCNNDSMAERCTRKNAKKVIWAIQGSADFNSQCALGLRSAFKGNQIRLLKSEYDADDILGNMKGYASLSPQEMLEYKLPYIHTSLLINELVNLEYETRQNVVRVKEKQGMRKDRYSSLSYNIYVAKLLERDMTLNYKKPIEELALTFRKPKIRKNYKGGM